MPGIDLPRSSRARLKFDDTGARINSLFCARKVLMNYSEHYFGFASGTRSCTIMGRRRPNPSGRKRERYRAGGACLRFVIVPLRGDRRFVG